MTIRALETPGFTGISGRMRTAPNRVVAYSPGPDPQIDIDDWRAVMKTTRSKFTPAELQEILHTPTRYAKPIDRFWSKVDVSGAEEGCWPWLGSLDTDGYGIFTLTNNINVRAHRLSFEIATGRSVAPGMLVDHRCHAPQCVNPGQLREVTDAQNMENLQGAQSNNLSSGIRNVVWLQGARKWRVRVTHDYKQHFIGDFVSKDDAEQAAIQARRRLHTHSDGR